MERDRGERPLRRFTKTIRLVELLEGKEREHKGFCLAIDVEDKRSRYYPLSWGWGRSSKSIEPQRHEYVVASILNIIDIRYKCGGLDKALELVAEKGEEGVDLTLTSQRWRGLFTSRIPRFGETMNIPKPQRKSAPVCETTKY